MRKPHRASLCRAHRVFIRLSPSPLSHRCRAQVIKEVPVEVVKYVDREVFKEVPVVQVVEKEVIKEVPVERIVEKEVVKEVPVVKYITVDGRLVEEGPAGELQLNMQAVMMLSQLSYL